MHFPDNLVPRCRHKPFNLKFARKTCLRSKHTSNTFPSSNALQLFIASFTRWINHANKESNTKKLSFRARIYCSSHIFAQHWLSDSWFNSFLRWFCLVQCISLALGQFWKFLNAFRVDAWGRCNWDRISCRSYTSHSLQIVYCGDFERINFYIKPSW